MSFKKCWWATLKYFTRKQRGVHLTPFPLGRSKVKVLSATLYNL